MDKRSRILLVEDSETQALLLRSVLEDEGWEVLGAATAEAALDALNRTVPDLIVVDYYLPGVRGDELCRQIRQNVATRGIPILMLTVEENDAAQLHGLESGADDYVSKAVEKDILILRIRALLRKSQTQSAILTGTDTLFRRARLLAIDDSPTYLEYLAGELAQDGYQVEKASSGKEGLELLSTREFDCVLVDLVMPQMDGVAVCSQITEMRRTMDNPIVVLMLTSRESKDDMMRGLEAGADDFVGKSSDMAVLKARIRALLRRKFFQQENQRIVRELKDKELEAVRARAETEAAEAKAALAEKLTETNRELEETNRRLKETQMHLIQSEKMASLGQLVAGIAHEINNPLAFVMNNLFTVDRSLNAFRSKLGSSLSPDWKKKLEKVTTQLDEMREGLDRVKELVLNLRTFSRLDEGDFKTVDIHQSIESALMFLNHKMKDRIEVVRNYGPVALLPCYAGQLNQVLLNVLANAVEAIERKGKITITTTQKNGSYLISVRDTGKGVPDSIKNRLFEPFFTTKGVGEGTGLGLSISYGIIQRHKGTIEVKSDEGSGSEFLVRIPLDLEG